MTQQTVSPGIPDDERLWAALCYRFYFVIPIVALLVEEQKSKEFIRYHAIQALIIQIISMVLMAILLVSIIGWCCLPLVWLGSLWPAYEAYQGKYLEIPILTDFARNQGWI
jgi:uncharacterized membrane protein